MKAEEFDAIIIGSGLCGGLAAFELTSSKLNVALIEKNSDSPSKFESKSHYAYSIQSKSPAFSEQNAFLFDNDNLHPYEIDRGRPFSWIRASALGGRSLLWNGHSYRIGAQFFKYAYASDPERKWPISYEELEPYYSKVEKYIGISGASAKIPEIPDSKFQPPIAPNPAESVLLDKANSLVPKKQIGTIARMAILTKEFGSRPSCSFSGPCNLGCSSGSLYNSVVGGISDAKKTKLLTIFTNTVCSEVLIDKVTGHATGVRVTNQSTGETREIYSRIVFLCASTISSLQILLNSQSSRFPKGIGNHADLLGTGLMDHIFMIGARGFIELPEQEVSIGYKPGGLYFVLPEEFRNTQLANFGIQAAAVPVVENPQLRGGDKQLAAVSRWRVWFGGWGECDPQKENRISLSSSVKDEYGVKQPRISFEWSQRDLKRRIRMNELILEFVSALGVQEIESFDDSLEPGLCAHEMGGAWMGKDEETSILNSFNQVHGIPNLFVTDGSCMPFSHFQSPSLTIMALTSRACTHALQLLSQRLL